jgi:hypothetical protein
MARTKLLPRSEPTSFSMAAKGWPNTGQVLVEGSDKWSNTGQTQGEVLCVASLLNDGENTGVEVT